MSDDELTSAMRALRDGGVAFRAVRTERPSTAEESARLQGVELGQLLRSIVVRRGLGDYVFVLVPGGRQIAWPRLRAHLGVSRLSLPDAEEAREATGYERGAITPLGAIAPWPVIVDAAAADRSLVAIGGGGRGVNVHLDPRELVRFLGAEVADVTVPEDR